MTTSLLAALSGEITALAARLAPSLVAIHGPRSLSTGLIWRPGLVLACEEALDDEGPFKVSDGDLVTGANLAGRDAATAIAILRAAPSGGDAGIEASLPHAPHPSAGALTVAVSIANGALCVRLTNVSRSGPAWRSMRDGEIDARIELDGSLPRAAQGGVALDAEGRLLGMLVAGPRRRTLVIPAATLARVIPQLETRGRIPRGYLGLGLQPVAVPPGDERGAIVLSVDPDGPGARAGLHQGDVIAGLGGAPLGSLRKLMRAVGPGSAGATLKLSIRRGGEPREVDVTLAERPEA
jgi:S1-C subfamily serine protease